MIKLLILNKMKKIFLIFTILIFLFSVKTVSAELNQVGRTIKNEKLTTSSAPAQRLKNSVTITPSANKVENLKERAEREIERRITSLNRLIDKINALKKISDSQKETFVKQIQDEITSLTNLKTKINADTDLTILKTDVQSIVKSYRVYLLFVPKINVLVAADSLDTIADKLDILAAKLEVRINTAGDVDATKLKTTLEDMKLKIADMRVQAQKARDAVIVLTPEEYPGNKTILQQGRQFIVAGKKDLQTARQDVQIIIQGLKDMKNTKTSTSSAER